MSANKFAVDVSWLLIIVNLASKSFLVYAITFYVSILTFQNLHSLYFLIFSYTYSFIIGSTYIFPNTSIG